MDGDWPLKETSPGRTTVEGDGDSQRATDSNWTLVEYRPGRYAKVAPDGTVVGRASEAEVRAWFGARSKEPPRIDSRSGTSAPSPEFSQATEGRGLQAWFAAQRQERQAAQASPPDAPSENTEDEARKPGIRDWLAAQRRDTQPDTDRVASDQPARDSGQSPDEFWSPGGVPADDRGAAARQPDTVPVEPDPADAEPHEEAQGQGTDPEPVLLQAELLPSEASEPGHEPGEPESAIAAVLETDLRQPEPSPQGPEELAAGPKAAVEPERDSPEPEAVQLAFMPAVDEEDRDKSLEGLLDPASPVGSILENPSPLQEGGPALMEPSPAPATEPVLEEVVLAQEREPMRPESPPGAVKVPSRESRRDEPAETPILEPDEPEPTQLAMEPGEIEEVEVTEPPAPGPMSSDRDERMTDEDLDADGDVDWLDPGSPPSSARPSGAVPSGTTSSGAMPSGTTARDQVPASAPSIPDATGAVSMRVGAGQDLDEAPPEPIAFDGYDRWLWVDPRQERGYDVGAFDLATFLSRAVDLFRSKEWTAGRKPARLAAHPDEVANGLKAMADGLGLEVVSDPRVTPGTYRLGLATDEDA